MLVDLSYGELTNFFCRVIDVCALTLLHATKSTDIIIVAPNDNARRDVGSAMKYHFQVYSNLTVPRGKAKN